MLGTSYVFSVLISNKSYCPHFKDGETKAQIN